ncbi:hypothetical protein DBR42_15405 [Pelomonas sp. HMWF004]|nr:hypothetical protein DBR42_15405 [Pelomonas sp. HMWF004]
MNLRRSLFITLMSRYALLLVNLVSSVIVARLLTPKEMGEFSLCMVLLSFAAIFRDFGASTYLTQTAELNAQKLRAAMGLQLLIGFGLAALVAVASVPMSAFYAEEGLRPLMLWVAASYLISPFGTVTQAILQREMKFGAIARIQVAAGVAAAAVTMGLAWLGLGAVSLAIGQLVSVCTSVAMTVPYRPRDLPWLPALKGSREILGFGGAVTGTAIINVIVKGAPEMLLGKLQGIHSVGLFARGQGMVIMFGRQLTDAVSSVALPNFSRLAREDGNVGEAFLHGTAYVTAVAWASCLGMAILARPLIEVLYGPQWHEAIPLVRWVAGAYGAGLSVMLVSSALTAGGAVKSLVWATLLSGVLTVGAVALGAYRSLEFVGVGLFVTGILHAGIFFWLAQSRLHFEWAAVGKVLIRSGVVAVCTTVLPLLIVLTPKPDALSNWLDLLAGACAGVLGFYVGVRLASHPLEREFQLVAEKLFRRFRSSAQ